MKEINVLLTASEIKVIKMGLQILAASIPPEEALAHALTIYTQDKLEAAEEREKVS